MSHRRRSLITLALSLGLIPATSFAQPKEPLRLADVLQEARENNPEIRAARERASAAAAIPPRVAA